MRGIQTKCETAPGSYQDTVQYPELLSELGALSGSLKGSELSANSNPMRQTSNEPQIFKEKQSKFSKFNKNT